MSFMIDGIMLANSRRSGFVIRLRLMRILDWLKNVSGRKILIYADFIDPFCYIGFHALRPLAEARGIALEWRGFELNPDTPPDGFSLVTAANSDLRPGMWASVQGLARSAGLEFPEPRWVPNTRKAHALLQGVKNPAVKNPLIERIYQAYFTGLKDIGRREVLMELTGAFSIPSEQVQAALSDPRITETPRARQIEAQRRNFMGMPGFVYQGKNHFGALSQGAWETILARRN